MWKKEKIWFHLMDTTIFQMMAVKRKDTQVKVEVSAIFRNNRIIFITVHNCTEL